MEDDGSRPRTKDKKWLLLCRWCLHNMTIFFLQSMLIKKFWKPCENEKLGETPEKRGRCRDNNKLEKQPKNCFKIRLTRDNYLFVQKNKKNFLKATEAKDSVSLSLMKSTLEAKLQFAQNMLQYGVDVNQGLI